MARNHVRTGHLFTSEMDSAIINYISQQGFINLKASFEYLATTQLFQESNLGYNAIFNRWYTYLRNPQIGGISFKLVNVRENTVYINRKQTKRTLL